MMTNFASLVTKLSIPLLLSITMVLILPSSGWAQETFSPSTEQASPPPSFLPTIDCQDTAGWRIYYASPGSTTGQYLFCHDNEVECNFKGAIGNMGYIPDALAFDHCCKCKQGCDGFCSASPESSYDKDKEDPSVVEEEEGSNVGTYVVIGAVAVVCCITCVKINQRSTQMQQALSSTRQTMSERRRQRFQSRVAGSPVTPTITTNPARDEQILIKFYFQRVLPDKSRTALESRAAIRSGEQEAMPTDSPVLPQNSTAVLERLQSGEPNEDEENLAGSQNKNQGVSPSSQSVLSQRLSSWRNVSASEECCICLDGYHPGDTISAPITDKCNHVFHEECVVEWLRNHDLCPLCRVNLME
eukprot:scaffold125_cov109-Cylindrotheca_fusiformis.AAC.3